MVGPQQQYDTYLSPVYLRTNTIEESVSAQSGELAISQTDYVLPGRNGLNVEIKRIYKSGTANTQEMKVKYVNGAWVDYVQSDATTSSFYENRYNIGVGMRFSFPQMEVIENNDGTSHKFVHTESGDVYRLARDQTKDEVEYFPEGQTIKDVTVKETGEYSNGQSDGVSKYAMTGKDGKKTFFAEDGRLLGIRDRYDNTINFEYSEYNYTIDGKTVNKKLMSKITDTVGRIITIEYREDQAFVVGPIKNESYSAEESWKASQNPNHTHSGDLQGKFQVVVHLPDDKTIVYDKSAVLVSKSNQVIRTRLQRVFDTDGKPKYHFWYEQPELGFTYMNGTRYAAFNRYENLVQIDYPNTNRIERYVYNTYTKSLHEGSMQYRKIFENRDLIKKGFDPSQGQFLDKFVTEVKNKTQYSYTSEPDGYGVEGYVGHEDSYLRDTYRYFSTETDAGGSETKYTYDGLHQLLLMEKSGSDHKEVLKTERDEMKLIKKKETWSYQTANGQSSGEPVKRIENYRYDQYGNLTNYTGPEASRDENGTPKDSEHTVIYSYDYDRFHALTLKTWKQDGATTNQIIYDIDDKGNVVKESQVNTTNPEKWWITEYAYDEYGNLTKKTASLGDQSFTTHYEYAVDANDLDVKGAYLTREYQSDGNSVRATKYGYEWTTGNLTVEIDPNGNKTLHQYDVLNRLTKTVQADQTSQSYSYVDSPFSNLKIRHTDAALFDYEYEYDITGALVRASVKNNGAWRVLRRIDYDSFGNIVKEIDANGHSSRYEYDSLNRLVKKSIYEKDAVSKGTTTVKYRIGVDESVPTHVTLTDEEGFEKKLSYDILDRLIKEETTPDKSRWYSVSYTYDYIGHPLTETNARGYTTSNSYNPLGQLVNRKDALGFETSYGYNALGQFAVLKEPGGKITESIYNAFGLLSQQKISQEGASDYTYVSYEYDKAGNALRIREGGVSGGTNTVSSDTSYTYDEMNRMTDEYKRIDDRRTGHSKMEYDANGNLAKRYEFSDASETKFRMYAYKYDFAARVTEESGSYRESDGQGGFREYGKYSTLNEWDYVGNLVKQSVYNGSGWEETELAYDHRNKVIMKKEPFGTGVKAARFQYDKVGNRISETLTVGGTPVTASFRYDGLGRMTMQIDPLGHTTRYVYDEVGNRIKEIDPRYLSLPETEASGFETEYDALNRPVKISAFDGTTREVAMFRQYDGRGNIVLEADGEGYLASDPDKSRGVLTKYDVNDRKIAVTSPQTMERNAQNGTSLVSETYRYDGSGRMLSKTDAYGNTTSYAYFLNGSLKSMTDPDGTIEKYDYDLTGKAMSVRTDRRDNVTKSYFSIFDKPYRIEHPDGGTERFDFSAKGEIIESADPLGNVKRYEYDASGLMTGSEETIGSDGDYELLKRVETAYDEAGRKVSNETFLLQKPKRQGLAQLKESAKDLVTYAYDKAGHLIKENGPFGREMSFAYDAAGNVTAKTVKADSGYSDVWRYDYDSRSRITSEAMLIQTSELSADEINGARFDNEYADRVVATTRYAYTKNDKLKSMTDAKGAVTQYEYDLDGRPVREIDPLQGVKEYRYDLKGRLAEGSDAKGATVKYEYDSKDRLIRMIAPSAAGQSAITRYIYDEIGNLVKEIAPNQYDEDQDNAGSALTLSGFSYSYDAMNRRTSTASPDGNGLEYIQYDAAGQVRKVADGLRYTGDMDHSSGTTSEYDGLGRIVAQTDALGHRTAYRYDVLGNLTEKLDARGNSTEYVYNPDGTLAQVIDADGGVSKYAYDKLGRMVSETNPLGAATAYRYTAFGKEKLVIDPDGHTVETKYDLVGNAVSVKDKRGSIALFEYDALNRLIRKKLPQELDASESIVYVIEAYEYDAVGNRLKMSLTSSKDRAFLRETRYTYSDNNLLLTAADNAGGFTRNSYDLNGNLVKSEQLREGTEYDIELSEYDLQNRVVKRIRLVDEANLDAASAGASAELRDEAYPGKIRLITGYEYDLLGNLVKEIDPRAYRYAATDTANRDKYSVSYSYDALDRLIQTQRKWNGADANTRIKYDEVGNRIEERNARGFLTQYEYDGMNRVVSKTDAENQVISYTYDRAGNKTSETNARGHTFSYEYDKLNRVVTVRDPYGAVIARHVYDAGGNLVKEIDAKGFASGSSDNARYGTVYVYDLAGRLSSITDREGAKTSYLYNPADDKIKETNGLGESYSFTYDNASRITEVTDPMGVSTTYSYDLLGNKLDMTNGRGKVTQYRYGAFGLLVETINPLNKPMTYRYDLALNLAEMTDRNGNHTRYGYDSRDLLIERNVVETEEVIRYAYDEVGNRTQMQDKSGVSSYAYDGNDRLKLVSKDESTQLAYAYDAAGNIVSVTDSKGFETVYTYDKADRMESVIANGKTTVYDYDTNGNRAVIAYEGGIKEVYTYDKNNQLLTLKNVKPNGELYSSYVYVYDAAGRQTSKTDSFGRTDYSYDEAGRLLQADAPGKTTLYSYDRAGNRQSQMETYTSAQPSGYVDPGTEQELSYLVKNSDYLYNASDELLRLVETMFDDTGRQVLEKTTSYLYDDNGNQLRSLIGYVRPNNPDMRQVTGGDAYGESTPGAANTVVEKSLQTFDGFNRLVRAERVKAGEQSIVTYQYDGDDLRTQKVSRSSQDNYAAKTTNYLYDRQYVILETDSADNVAVRYVRGVDYISRADDVGKLSYYLFNGHGDVVHTVGETGTVENQYDYDSFGNPTLTIEIYSSSIRYAGEFFDAEVGFYYLRARYYDPYIGRFISEDSYWGENESPLSLNRYTYVHNDPVNFFDPTGNWQQGDEKLSLDDQKKIKKLTDAYTSASSSNEKNQIVAEATRIRTESAQRNDNNHNNGDSFSAAVNSVIQRNGSISNEQWRSLSVQFERRSEGRIRELEAPARYTQYGNPGLNLESRMSNTIKYSDYKVGSLGYIQEMNLMNRERGSKKTLDFIANDIKDHTYEIISEGNHIRLYNSIKQLAAQERIEQIRLNPSVTPILGGIDNIHIEARTNLVIGNAAPNLFKDSDFDLKQEVQQMIAYYDDANVYSYEALRLNVIDFAEYDQYQLKLRSELAELRKTNSLGGGSSFTEFLIADILIGEILTNGVLGSPDVAYAASLDMTAGDKISKSHVRITGAITANKKYNYSVYEMVDDEGKVRYVGRTRQDINKREKQHQRSDPNKKNLRIKYASTEDGRALKGLMYEQARGLEQMIYEQHIKNGNKLLNKIRPLDIGNPKRADKVKKYLEAARKFIGKVK
ncbi:RHS repeat-associated core domain-containing protein [Cohnella cellulosilytica]|uniref:RHS repeat-associated core domain-containing protein n=1 Tax=Cohnella cellulosilytica TaxID=986710 RepID=UPI00360A6B16